MNNKSIYLILFFIVLFHLAGNYYWLKKNDVQYESCHPFAFYTSQVIFTGDSINVKSILRYCFDSYNYPPFQLLFGAAVMSASDRNFQALILVTNTFWMILSIFLTYKIGEFVHSKEAGITAALLLSMYPAFYLLSRHYTFHFALIPAVALSIYCLLKTEGFENTKWSVILGMSLLLGTLVKHPFIVFLAGPLVYMMSRALIKRAGITVIRNMIYSVAIGLSFDSVFYFNPNAVKKIISNNLLCDPAGPWYKLENLKVYTTGVPQSQLSPLLFLLFLFGLYIVIKKYKVAYVKVIFILWILVPLLILIFMPHNKESSYITPYLPALAVISAIGTAGLKRGPRYFILCFSFILSLLLYSELSSMINLNLQKINISIAPTMEMSYFRKDVFADNNEAYKAISSYIESKNNTEGIKTKTLVLVQNALEVNMNVIRNLSWHRKLDIDVFEGLPTDLFAPGKNYDTILFAGSPNRANTYKYLKLWGFLNKYRSKKTIYMKNALEVIAYTK
ncbi:MAG: glycosyltransferase family 39 protein [Elusimicrobia bacterium]|nr:glycosyltransferase family 39 protein [Candidatus Liberimonas magnetica]